MLKYVSKFALDILPSVVATIIGAYIVNHYIVTKPGANAPVAAAVSTAEPTADAKVAPEAATADSKPSETSSSVANIPEPGVKAKGISEKAVLEKSAAEKPAERSADKPAETASIPVETRRHQFAPREKAIAKAVPAPVQPPAVVSVPVVAAPTTAPPSPPVETAIAPEEHRDANELARAAIERLRGAGDSSPRPQEAARIPEAPRVPDAARVPDLPHVVSAPAAAAPPVRPLPPPIMVSTPGAETVDSASGSSQMKPPYTGAARIDDPRRPTPPADIPITSPASRPLDLRAEAVEPPAREHTTVAEDMLSAAKSVFHAVLPK
jgi:hypothetical protein